MVRKPAPSLIVAALAACLAFAPGTTAAERPVRDAVTTLAFDEELLGELGLAVTGVEATGSGPVHRLSLVRAEAPRFAATAPAGLRVELREGALAGFHGGPLRHRGGLALAGRGGRFDFRGVELRPGEPPKSLLLVEVGGEPLLATAQAQWELDPAGDHLSYFNSDLRILPALARRLGDPRLAGATVGTLELEIELQTAPEPARDPSLIESTATPPPCGDWSGSVDVALTTIESVSQVGSVAGGKVVVTPSVTLENAGTANVPWYLKFSGTQGPYDNDQHPFLVWQLLREEDGVLEPLGRSDLKHAFATENVGCDPGACTDPHILGLGCADTYPVSSNTSNNALAPREEVTASTGIWAHCDEPTPGVESHFDTDGNCVQDFFGNGETAFTHGMAVATAELGHAGARYFLEAFYVVRDDVNIFNSMGFREVAPAFASIWTFPVAGPYTFGPTLDAWVDPASPAAGEANRVLDTGEGHLQLAVKVTAAGGGRRRYVYALANHDFDRRISSFRVPFDAAVGTTDLAFADGDGVAANDWDATVDSSGVTWTAPADNALDWGTLFSFVLETDQKPFAGAVPLAVVEPGDPTSLTIATLVPHGLFTDGFESGDLSAWSATP